MRARKKRVIAVACMLFLAFIILFITILTRFPSLSHSIRLTPFWSYAEVFTGQRSPSGILLNIALFIPLGWFLATVASDKRKKYILLLTILLSITIELIQYYTGRGTADIDDVISNTLGGMMGALIFYCVERLSHGRWEQLLIPVLSIFFLTAACIGAYTIYSSPHLNSRLREYDFVVEDVSWNDDALMISGECNVYDSKTPLYQLILSDGEPHPLETVTDDDRFIATGKADGGKKYEVLIRFSGHETMSTGTFVNGKKVEFIAGSLPVVDGVPEGAVLKAYDVESDTLVFQDGDHLLWLIGTEIEPTAEIIYHIYTDEKQKLPENRKKYGFDNKGFMTRTGIEMEPIGHYHVFGKELPSEYHVAEVIVGFNMGGKVLWEQNFRVEIRE